MTEFDPAALLKQIRAKTPTRTPELPPRPVTEEPPPSKANHMEERMSALEQQLKQSQQNEQKYQRERDNALQQIKDMQMRLLESESKFTEKISFLESLLEQKKSRANLQPAEPTKVPKPSKTPPKPKPPFTSAVSASSLRPVPKSKGTLDLSPLIELYKLMPEFPRPVIKINFSGILNS